MIALAAANGLIRADDVSAFDPRLAIGDRSRYAVAMAASLEAGPLFVAAPVGRSPSRTIELWGSWAAAIESLGVAPGFVARPGGEFPSLVVGQWLIVAGPDSWACSRSTIAAIESAIVGGAMVHFVGPRKSRWSMLEELGVASICYPAESPLFAKFRTFSRLEATRGRLNLSGDADDLRSRVIAAIERGASFAEAGQLCGCCAKTAWLIGQRWATRKAKRLTDEQRETIRQALGSERESYASIAKMVGCHKSTVALLAKEFFPNDPNVCQAKRCPSCGAKITTVRCLRCSVSPQ